MKIKPIKLDNKIISQEHKPFIIAEIGQAHDGSLGIAHSYIEAVAKAGVDAVKFQTHLANEESTEDDEFRINFSYQDNTRFDYWKRMEFSKDQWRGLYEHALEENLVFLSSPFSKKALEMLIEINVPAIKIASGEAINFNFLNLIAKSKIPVLLSTGMSYNNEIRRAVKLFKDKNIPIACMQCTSKYPLDYKDVGLNVMVDIMKNENIIVGYSDHSGSLFPPMNAMSKGANLIEVHVTFDKRMFGPDTSSSISIEELKQLVDYRDAVFQMDKSIVDKDQIAKELLPTRKLFTKSLSPIEDIKRGTVIDEKMLTLKKPGTGIPYEKINKIIGKKTNKSVSSNRLIKWSDIEQ